MSDQPYTQGGDAQAISDIAKKHYGGSYKAMFEAHGWVLENGQQYMHQASSRIKATYGSVREFEAHFRGVEQARAEAKAVWPDGISVLFTSFWGWTPEDWGTVGWTGDAGRTRRDNLLNELTDPFICVCYVTSNHTRGDPNLKGMFGGFYLVSHETGDRDEFTHPIHHGRDPDKWRHSLRAIRAFSYLPEYRPRAIDVFPELSRKGQPVSKWGQVIIDQNKIDELRSYPWVEVPVFSSRTNAVEPLGDDLPTSGMVLPGPASSGGYVVSEGTQNLPRELYILRLTGDTDTYLGRPAEGASIFKIGLSVSPDLRRQSFQKSMPRGAFEWKVDRTTREDGHAPYSGHRAAVAGETAMKVHLAQHAEWLGGEFYLATQTVIDAAWRIGRDAARDFDQKE